MKSTLTKAIAAFFGGGGGSALMQLILYWSGILVLEPSVVQLAISSVGTGLLAAYTVWQSPANTITTGQVVASAKAGELTKALAGVENKTDALAVAKAVTAPAVGVGMVAAGAPASITPKPIGAST